MAYFNEGNTVEQMLVNAAGDCGWIYVEPQSIPRQPDDVLVAQWLSTALMKFNDITADQAEQVIYRLRAACTITNDSDELISANDRFRRMLFDENSYPFGADGENISIRFFSDNPDENRHTVTHQWVFPRRNTEGGKSLDIVFLMADTHDDSVLGLGRDCQAVRQSPALQDQRMIPCRLHRLRQTFVNALTAVFDTGGFSVDDFRRAHDLRAEDFADGLMAETDAENRHDAFHRANQFLGDARVLRLAGARGNHDAAVIPRRQFPDRRHIVPHDLDLRAQLREKLVHIISKGIVIIQEEQHRFPPPRPL